MNTNSQDRETRSAIGPVPLRFPERFLGLFAARRNSFGDLLSAARDVLSAYPVPQEVRTHYEYAVLSHPQPSFMLLPLMYLELAETTGRIGDRHKKYLPWVMLSMELCAVLDDTVDQTPFRSGRHTYAQRFGACSAAPFSCFLLNVLVSKTLEEAPEALPLVTDLFQTLCTLQVWEIQDRYPSVEPEALQIWLQRHYDEVTPAIAYGLNSALLLGSCAPLPATVCARFAQIMQDVDDLVNIAERRDLAGENSDFALGIVTYPLLAALDNEPGLLSLVEAIWQPHRKGRRGRDCIPSPATAVPNDSRLMEEIIDALMNKGIPATLSRIELNAAACVAATPIEFRSTIREFMSAFVDRARRAAEQPAVALEIA